MIPIQNIYYMLSYSFTSLRKDKYRKLATEPFSNATDLFAEIMIQGVSSLVKRGIKHDYRRTHDELTTLRGRIDITESIRPRVLLSKRLACTYDDYTVNSYMNQIIKSVMLLLHHADIRQSRKKSIRSLLTYFYEIEALDLQRADWHIRYDKNDQTYRMLIGICYLIVNGLLQSKTDGSTKLMDFLDEQSMSHLYEKFILEYYRQEFPNIKASSSYIDWQLDTEEKSFLPIMHSDVLLNKEDRTLIIDAKYYTATLQNRFDKRSIHSNNLYQIFSYVKNKEIELSHREHSLSGMLLYAKTDEDVTPDVEYQMSGNSISARTLDLNQDFSGIQRQLNEIAQKYLGLQ